MALLSKSGMSAARSDNRVSVLEAIRRNRGISRAELAIATGLTPAAISKIVGGLLEAGLVIESGYTASGGGRPRVRLGINPEAAYVIGVDLARSGICAALVNLDGLILRRYSVASTLAHPIDVTVARLIDLLDELMQDTGPDRTKIAGIGIGAPGPLSVRNGVILSPPNFAGWRDVPLREIVERHLGIPAWIDNDANACALAEAWLGAGQALSHFVYVAVGTGVGAGLVINGALYRGANDIAGEFGHTTVEASGPRCGCGNVGCLELYTSASAITSAAIAAIRRGEPSIVVEWIQGHLEEITVSLLARAARCADRLAIRVFEQSARYLGVGVVNLVNLFDPEAVFLGREVVREAEDLLLDPIRAMVSERAFSIAASRVRILPATLGEEAPVLGAACLALQELFRSPERLAALAVGRKV